jgi:hypothetical protein
LAIELAATRLRVMSVEQIADRLDNRFHLLTSGNSTGLPRHQTLRAMVDWSYDLLSEAERALLRQLSVFVGGWPLEAVEGICGSEALNLLRRVITPVRGLRLPRVLIAIAPSAIGPAPQIGCCSSPWPNSTVRITQAPRLRSLSVYQSAARLATPKRAPTVL